MATTDSGVITTATEATKRFIIYRSRSVPDQSNQARTRLRPALSCGAVSSYFQHALIVALIIGVRGRITSFTSKTVVASKPPMAPASVPGHRG